MDNWGCLHLLPIVNNATVNICVQYFFEHLFPILLGGIAGLYGNYNA